MSYYKNKVRKHASLVDQENFLTDKKAQGLIKAEGSYVIEQSYSGREQKKILNQFRIYFDEQSIVENGENKLDFQKLIDFIFKIEIQKHMQYLKMVSDFYNTLDHDHNGVITRKQFLQLLDIFV